ncbi:hypothetical protein [Kineobactrum salinum]|uniref:Uncharacterized protein n=1 Tax=Kineobactrum salinum TaxID=2708301 RepID=A0A6C0UBJ4_9GAMM|nr:hypothetical protein [Kineobactrum salinum]QIB67444.1 hypothetical protein G3T16_20685 [Kineobactrum salinum]
MHNPWQLSLVSFIAVLVLIAALAWLTQAPEPDPCADTGRDVAAAVLADQAGDQEALVNRAIIQRGVCEDDGKPAGRQ